MTGDLIDPRTGLVRGRLTDSGGDAAAVVARARAAAPAWAAFTPRDRARRLLALADRLDERASAYAAAEVAGTGKPAADAREEVEQAADLFRFYAGAVRAELGPGGGQLIDGHESWVRFEPLGVVAAIVPWNYPLMMAAWRCAPALAAGNTVVLKPAETTPDTALLLAEDAAILLGPGVLQTLTGGRECGTRLVEAEVDAVAFTGSGAGGLDVARRAGTRRISLELGGNCPVLVLPDAPERTWADLADAATYNAGQSCAAPARVIAVGSAYATAVAKLGAALAGRTAGRDFGPLNNAAQAERYDRLVDGAKAEVRTAGAVEADGGYFRPACLLAGLPDDDPAVTEEVFGPVLTVQPARDLDEALRLAGSVPQALAASVWTAALDTALHAARRLDAGETWVNCHLVQTAELPHGGRGASGTGTDLSVLALAEYRRPKTVTVNLR
ncbi:acyl-CoA reductase-like NAD-dependent aldehyde dehydrogenase [Actinocorallia herbida]|uniref:Acyl-CoA reductase-like NAD-dependent aldehyde dehydrogenase n=1 Tax=Actinocorallia herbida TaxID=58109 RepID=A0A3N1DBD3_9ACTN|nr:aldehyde dehydrogenase family protein [Actinocorallia herbida]ROO90833.1 acyl-CoA reductase-like NAD-dependent aldehyde dehydrogenase [Actinocorallia herbida]